MTTIRTLHKLGLRLASIAVFVAVLLAADRAAEAQNLRVIPVPWVATDVTVPHQAYNGHATTFKAIARGGNGTYQFEWDFDGDGVYDFSASTTNRYNLSTRFTYPNQAATVTFNARIRVTSGTDVVTAVYPVRVFSDVPLNPATATDRQLQVMRGVAVDDGLWFLHNLMSRSGNEEDPLTGAQITATVGSHGPASAAGLLWALSLNGHYAAYGPAYIGEMPDPAENAYRLANDPYAEDAARLINYILTQATINAIPATDEVNLVGFYPEIQKEPIYGTDDGFGFYTGPEVYYMGHVLSGLSVARLGGYVAQVGDPTRILGRRMEHVLQQYVDGMVWAQSDTAGVPLGNWHYSPNASSDDMSTTLWGMTGLWHAEEFATDQGVIVPNMAKTRLLQFIQQNQNTCPGAGAGPGALTGGSYNTSGNNVCDHTLTAGHLLALGWVGSNQFATTDTRLAFPSYNSITRGQLRTQFDSTLNFISGPQFANSVSSHIGWNTGTVEGGNFARTDGRGNHYDMLHWQDASRATEPEITMYGTNNWARLYAQYLINNQATNGDWNWVYGGTSPNSDNSGGNDLRAGWAVLVLSPDAIPPLAIGETTVLTATEGTAIPFSGAESDPGTGNPTYTWDFDNGDTMPGQNVVYTFPDDEDTAGDDVFNVTLTSTSIGGTSTDTVQVTITNVAPTATANGDVTVNEGTAQPFTVTYTDPGSGDTHTFAWDFDDGVGTSTAQNPSYTYADNGTYDVAVVVSDDDLGTDTENVAVTVNNVNPTITSTPATTATEGAAYTYTATFTDPGTADTHTCTAPVMPAGMTFDAPTCTVTWTPDFAQAIGAAPPVRVCVTDDDLGQTCQDWTVTVSFVDTDGDLLPDSWENANFGDLGQGSSGDPDGDGASNLDEFVDGTDPTEYDGPEAPVPATPVCDTEISSLQITLVADNATDPQATALLYQFELYSDPGLGTLVADEDNIAEGAGGQTSWQVPVNLLENVSYYWRVRARDSFTYGAYSTVCVFHVNTVNEAPGTPRINTPAFGGQVAQLQPNLIIDNATDPDPIDVLTYEYEVYTDPALSNQVAAQVGVASGAGATTTWMVDTALMEDRTYYWRARATDQDALSGDWSATGQFFVTTVNAAPEPPVLLSPQNGVIVSDVRPELIISNADDSDLDQLVYDWDLAEEDTFVNIIDGDTDAASQGLQNTSFQLAADLDEDTRYCWRARSDDGAATSPYNVACFLVSTVNDPPTVPTLSNPGDDGETNTTLPVFSWMPSTDPENEPITYTVEVYDADDALVASVSGVSGTVTSVTTTIADAGGELVNGQTYEWRARAHDASGGMSDFSERNSFLVDAPIDDPEVVVNGGGCQTGSNGRTGLLMFGLIGLGLAFMLRRRDS